MLEAKVYRWDQAREIVERLVEEKVGGRIKESWVESIHLTPHGEGSKWIVKLRLLVHKGLFSKMGYSVHAVIDAMSGEVTELEISESLKR